MKRFIDSLYIIVSVRLPTQDSTAFYMKVLDLHSYLLVPFFFFFYTIYDCETLYICRPRHYGEGEKCISHSHVGKQFKCLSQVRSLRATAFFGFPEDVSPSLQQASSVLHSLETEVENQALVGRWCANDLVGHLRAVGGSLRSNFG